MKESIIATGGKYRDTEKRIRVEVMSEPDEMWKGCRIVRVRCLESGNGYRKGQISHSLVSCLKAAGGSSRKPKRGGTGKWCLRVTGGIFPIDMDGNPIYGKSYCDSFTIRPDVTDAKGTHFGAGFYRQDQLWRETNRVAADFVRDMLDKGWNAIKIEETDGEVVVRGVAGCRKWVRVIRSWRIDP